MDDDSEDLQVESFATWLLMAQLSMASLSTSPIPAALTRLAQAGEPRAQEISVVLVDKNAKPASVHDEAEGYHIAGDDKVYIPTWSDVYKKAGKGDPNAKIKLASIIAHEAEHARGGGEKQAYDKQIKVLRNLNAPNDLVVSVFRAMNSVVK